MSIKRYQERMSGPGTGILLLVMAIASPLAAGSDLTHWSGEVNSLWEVEGNWSDGVPDETTDAIIGETQSGLARVIEISDAAARDLAAFYDSAVEVFDGGELTVRNLTIGRGELGGIGGEVSNVNLWVLDSTLVVNDDLTLGDGFPACAAEGVLGGIFALVVEGGSIEVGGTLTIGGAITSADCPTTINIRDAGTQVSAGNVVIGMDPSEKAQLLLAEDAMLQVSGTFEMDPKGSAECELAILSGPKNGPGILDLQNATQGIYGGGHSSTIRFDHYAENYEFSNLAGDPIHLSNLIRINNDRGVTILGGDRDIRQDNITVNGGTLVINGHNTSEWETGSATDIVGPNGTMRGLGSVGNELFGTRGNQLTNAGVVWPGHGAQLGTLSVRGNYIDDGGELRLRLAADGDHDMLPVSGSADFNGGTVRIQVEPGDYDIGTQFTVLTAGDGISGEPQIVIEENVDMRWFDVQVTNNAIVVEVTEIPSEVFQDRFEE